MECLSENMNTIGKKSFFTISYVKDILEEFKNLSKKYDLKLFWSINNSNSITQKIHKNGQR